MPVTTVRADMDDDDNALVLRARNGCEDSYFQLVGRYKNRIAGHVFRMVGEWDKALDLTQDVFVQVSRHLGEYDCTRKFSSWIYAIATRIAIDELRRRKRRGVHVPLELDLPACQPAETRHPWVQTSQDPEALLLRREASSQIAKAVEALPPDLRQIFVLKEIDGLPLETISELTGTKIGTLKSRLFRIRASLQKTLMPLMKKEMHHELPDC